MESIKVSITDMMDMFNKRMAEFETELHKTPAANISNTCLATEFSTFRTFIMEALGALQQQVQLLSRGVDDLEMRGRRKMLLLHGVPEISKEETAQVVAKVIRDHFKIDNFSDGDIKRCHRMGRSTSLKPRPIVIKLHSIGLRDTIWFDKNKLKGTGITISEFLTKQRHDLFMDAREMFGVTNCWTKAGFVYVLGADGTKHRITTKVELGNIGRQQQQQPQQSQSQEDTVSKTQPASELKNAATKLKRAAARK